MLASKIQIKQYFLSGFNYSVNPVFDPDREVKVNFSDISEEHHVQPLHAETLADWQVDLKVVFTPTGDSNAPYSFSAHITGLFSVNQTIEKGKIHALIEANATSVLYSTLREIIFTITAKGPYFPLLLPTPCFHEQNHTALEIPTAHSAPPGVSLCD